MTQDPSIPDAAQAPNSPGGEGGRAHRDPLADLSLFRHALAQGWPIPPELKARARERLAEMLANDKAGDRAWTAAARTLVSMSGQTLASIDVALRAKASEVTDQRLAEIERRLDEHAGSPPEG